MKTKLSEQEQFYARKNRRREWWVNHWVYFTVIPLAVICIIAGLALLAIIAFNSLSIKAFEIGKDYDKVYHPQDWQRWTYETNTTVTNVVIYNRS
jgi:hypothetical protein